MSSKSYREYDYIIVGAGIVGLALAREILFRKPGIKICVLEREEKPALHQSGNNSGVVHSGIYYKPGSLKAQNCLRGYQFMMDYLRENKIPHEVCGKIIAAVSEDELPALQRLFDNGRVLGLDQTEWLSGMQCGIRQPGLKALSGIWVPYTAITDYGRVCESLASEILDLGGEIRFQTAIRKIGQSDADVILTSGSNEEFHTHKAAVCAGLRAGHLARASGLKIKHTIIPFKGSYYDLKRPDSVSIGPLVYPVPNPAFPFLGVHWTRHLDGSISLGPNAVPSMRLSSSGSRREALEYLTRPAFWKMAWRHRHLGMAELLKSGSPDHFAAEGSRFGWKVRACDLKKGKTGVRALLVDHQGNLVDDFVVLQDGQITHVLNAPSPAATASLSIARTLVDSMQVH